MKNGLTDSPTFRQSNNLTIYTVSNALEVGMALKVAQIQGNTTLRP